MVDCQRRFSWPVIAAIGLFASMVLPIADRWPTIARTIEAQNRHRRESGRFSFDPDKMFEQFFGKETEAQKRALAKVQIPWKEERQFGQQAADRFLAELKRQKISVKSKGPEIKYLRSLVSLVRPQMKNARRYSSLTVLLADSPRIDARCFPGGTLVVFQGMLDNARSEAALVGVLGHELSHIDHGHQLRHLKTMKMAQRTFSGGGMADFQSMMNNTMLMTSTFARPFRPEDEAQADADGTTWAYRLGYDPRELAKLFLRMEKRAGKAAKSMPSFFRSHPFNRDRYEAVLRRYRELRGAEPRGDLYVGQENLTRRIPASVKKFDR